MNEHADMEDFLAHYGVRGMKWGVRKNTKKSLSRAFRKASKKQTRLTNKANKLNVRGTKRSIKGIKRNNAKLHFKGLRDQMKSAKARKKADAWEMAMRQEFAEVSISQLDDKALAKGEAFVYMLLNK